MKTNQVYSDCVETRFGSDLSRLKVNVLEASNYKTRKLYIYSFTYSEFAAC